MRKNVVQDYNLVKEVEIMRQLSHPNIIVLREIFESDSELTLVLELYVYAPLLCSLFFLFPFPSFSFCTVYFFSYTKR